MSIEKNNIGIIGAGYVGKALIYWFNAIANVRFYDKYIDSESFESVVNNSNILFVCVPTPMKENGECDTSIVETVCQDIYRVAKTQKMIVVKSTVPPGTTEKISQSIHHKHCVAFNPEFLTEANFIRDFMLQDRIILGWTNNCSYKHKQRLIFLYEKFLIMAQGQKGDDVPIIETSSRIAEMLKYSANAFLATKVTFFNEIYDICTHANIDFNKVASLMCLDKRIGDSHNKVPGPDRDRGFGGKCFVKDINGLMKFSEQVGFEAKFLKAVWEKNSSVRTNKDWEQIRGATTKYSYDDE